MSAPPTSVAKNRKYRRTMRPRRPGLAVADGATSVGASTIPRFSPFWSADRSDQVWKRDVQRLSDLSADHPLERVVGCFQDLDPLGSAVRPQDLFDLRGRELAALELRHPVRSERARQALLHPI